MRLGSLYLLLLSGCGAAHQPESLKTVAAYEVPLPHGDDKRKFLSLLRAEAVKFDFHVDASTEDELVALSTVSPITFNAAVWRGDDEESIASAMDFKDHVGCVWFSFSKGENPARSAQFRNGLMPAVRKMWPDTAALPIIPNGAIPLTADLVRTPAGYVVKSSAAAKYNETQKSGPTPGH